MWRVQTTVDLLSFFKVFNSKERMRAATIINKQVNLYME
jgi:hypothetical protein